MTTTEYTPDQQAAVDSAVADALANKDNFAQYLTGAPLAQRGQQLFALFPHAAYQVRAGVIEGDDNRFEYLPVWTPEHGCVGEFPEEGRCGVLHLMRCTKRRGVEVADARWFATYVSGGWIRPEEINAGAQDILDTIADEIDAGATHLTGGRPGWA